LRAADAEELRIILAGDAHAEQAFMHPNYIVNTPANRIVRKDQLIKMLSEGQIASDFHRRLSFRKWRLALVGTTIDCH
jgi:hypothetical protein